MDESVIRHLEQQNEVADILRRAKALIGRPERWLHGRNALNTAENRRCMGCAIIHAKIGNPKAIADFTEHVDLLNSVSVLMGWKNLSDMFSFNADPNTTHADVMAAFDKAIALAESRSQGTPS